MQDEDFEELYNEDDNTCGRCLGEGEINICIDDMCQGLGTQCMHGDYVICPACDGTGVYVNAAKAS
jgi:hypothetical protein